MLISFKGKSHCRGQTNEFPCVIPASPPVPGSDPCSFPGILMSNETGTGVSNGFATDGTGSYRDNSDCRWQITVPENHVRHTKTVFGYQL